MLKRFYTITVLVALLLVPAMAFSADSIVPKAAVAGADNTVIIPLELTSGDGLVAIDVPLKFSEGVTLKEVTFENTRTEYFDLKIATIDNEKNWVLLGLLPQATPTLKPPLTAGSGPIANLVFEIDDQSITDIELQQWPIRGEGHQPMLVYRGTDTELAGFDKETLEMPVISVSIAALEGDGLPLSFSLEQNYPNPFNPSTDISFSLPAASHVELDIYNVLGQQVMDFSGDYDAGTHNVVWDGRSSSGGQVASGVYFYRIVTDSDAATKKMMLLK